MTLEEARRFFSKDLFASETAGIVIEDVAENYAKCSMKIKDVHKNAVGQVMGGAIFTLADFAFAVATNDGEKMTVTSVSNINYTGTAKGDTLIAETKLIKDGKRNCVYQIEIKDDLENLVALVVSSGAHLR